jgi:predicted phage terminase large subunit-like protein
MAEENDALGRESGGALWPERYPLEVLEKIKVTIGSAAFVSLYQQRPSAATGNVFLREWWRTYSEPPAEFKRIVLSLDSAFKVGEESDFSVATVWGATRTGFYLLHMWRQRVEFPKLKQMIVELATEWKANVLLVEDAASGQSLIQELKAGTTLPVLPIKPDRDKVSRANAVTPLIECGKVFIPESAPWKDTWTLSWMKPLASRTVLTTTSWIPRRKR